MANLLANIWETIQSGAPTSYIVIGVAILAVILIIVLIVAASYTKKKKKLRAQGKIPPKRPKKARQPKAKKAKRVKRVKHVKHVRPRPAKAGNGDKPIIVKNSKSNEELIRSETARARDRKSVV